MAIRDGGSVEFGVKITADNQVFINGVKASSDELAKLRDQVKGAGDAAEKAGGQQEGLTASVVKGTGAVEILKRAWDDANELLHEVVASTEAAQQSHLRLQAVLTATGNVSGQTADSVENLAQQMAKLTVFDDKSIRDAATTLSTFDQVAGDTFTRIIKLSADLAATGRGDLQTWVTILGKVGQEPVAAIGALERSLGKMNPVLKVAVQNAADFGNNAAAMNLILDEVQKRVGGTATAAYSGLTRQIEGTTKAWTDLKIAIGNEIFSAQSKDASLFEKALVSMADTFRSRMQAMRDAFSSMGSFGDVIRVLMGLPPTMVAAGQQAGTYARGGPNFASGSIQAAPASAESSAVSTLTASDYLTNKNKQQLRQQELQNLQAYYDEVYKLASAETDREIALLNYQHQAGFVSETDYIDQLGALKVKKAQDDANRIALEINTQNQMLANEEAELTRATASAGAGNISAPAEILAALESIAATKSKITVLTQQEGDAQKNVDEQVKTTDHDHTLYSQHLADQQLAVQRDQEDYVTGLKNATDQMQVQLGLVNADTVSQQQALNAEKIRLDTKTKILAINREIDDLESHGGDPKLIQQKLDEIDTIKKASEQAIVEQGQIIANTFDANAFKEIAAGFTDAVSTGIFQGGKAGAASLKNFLEQEFNKLVLHPILDPIFSQGASLIFGGAGGAGTAAQGGSALSSGSGLVNAFSNILPSGALGSAFGAGATGLAASLGVENAGYLALIGEVGSFIPVIGAAVAAIAVLYQVFADKGENWQATLGFGSNAQAYITQGTFGTEGFQSIQGQDATNKQIQAFMASTHPIDQALAAGMTPAQITAVQASLGAPYTSRNDGQPAQFAFGPNDQTAGQQLTLEYLQHKYGAIFDQIDTQFATFIRNFSGSSTDLLKDIGDYATAFTALQKLNIKGLDMTTVQAWQQTGETLPQTLTRIATAYGQFDDAFMTSDQKIAAAQKSVTDVFTNLGIAVPQSSEAFYDLVHSIDVSTDAGRQMVETLMGVAPAFQSVEQAAAQAVDTFNSIASQLSPTFGAANAKSVLDASVQAWMGLSPNNQNGWTVDSTISNIGSLVSGGNIGQALTYAQSLGGNAVSVLNSMLSAYQGWQSAINSSSSSVSTSFNNVSNAVSSFTGAIDTSRASVANWLQGIFTDQNLSPLTPAQQLDYTHDQYVENLMQAQGGNTDAISQFPTLANSYLSHLLSFSGPGAQYSAAFAAVTQQGAGLVGLSATRPPTAGDMASGFASVVAELKNLSALTGVTNSNISSLASSLDVTSKRSATVLKQAVNDGALNLS